MEIEEQKQKQLELLEQIEQQKLRLETDCFRAQLEEEENRKKIQQPEVGGQKIAVMMFRFRLLYNVFISVCAVPCRCDQVY